MNYQHIVRYVANTLWAIDHAKLVELLDVLAFRAAGHEFTPEELQARLGASQELRAGAPSAGPRGAAAIIPIRGVIAHRMGGMNNSSGGTSCEGIAGMIDQIAGNANIPTIIYDFETPGGTVPGVQELAQKIYDLRGQKKQIAMINGMAASAGYWLASQCDEIVSMPSGSAGSIGVFTAHQDLSKALEKEGIDVTLISAGKYKVEGNPFEPLTDETRAFLQDRVDTTYAQFIKDVARGRGVTQASVRDGYGEGRTLGAKDALKAGLIDRIGTMDETIVSAIGGGSASGMRASADVAVDESDLARRLGAV